MGEHPGVLDDVLESEVFGFCYRMLGSFHDAQDATQEVRVRVWQGMDRFERRSSLRTWVLRIAHNVCVSMLRGRGRRRVVLAGQEDLGAIGGRDVASGPTRAEQVDLLDRYVRRESTELALLAVLHHLPPNQRAAFLLRDVLGFTARSAAEAMGTTATAITSALQHARAAIGEGVRDPRDDPDASDPRLAEVARAYAAAFEAGDLAALMRLLAEDVTWAMPPGAAIVRGRPAVSLFLQEGPLRQDWRHLPVPGEPVTSVACYARRGEGGAHEATAVDVLDVRAGRIRRITSFLDPVLLTARGLPSEVVARRGP